jgi:hypothetical protein
MSRRIAGLSRTRRTLPFAALVCLIMTGCNASKGGGPPRIEFSRVPSSGTGNPDKLEAIEGRVSGAQPGQRIVLFAEAGVWWVQPLGSQPYTQIQADSTWKSWTHPGTSYAALLVDSKYHAPMTIAALPQKGGSVLAVATAQGAKAKPSKTLEFSGYEWEIRSSASNRAGTMNIYNPANVRTDASGLLHLRVARKDGHWTSGEANLTRSLGYGSYRFVVRDISRLEPGAVFSLFTWDDGGPSREMDVEISRWGEAEDKNAQFVVQPYFVPANTVRFAAPAGTLGYTMRWEPGRVSFQVVRGSSPNKSSVVSEHKFTSGVPVPGNEMVHVNAYVYGNKRSPLQQDFEVILEKFEFLP